MTALTSLRSCPPGGRSRLGAARRRLTMFGKKKQAELKAGDAKFLSEVRAAQVMDDMSRATWTLYLTAGWCPTARSR